MSDLSGNILLVMPFGTLERPSIAASMIQSEIRRKGHACDVHYANLDFANRIGAGAYETLSRRTKVTDLVGEWIFAEAAFGSESGYRDFFWGYLVHESDSITLLLRFFDCASLEELETLLDGFRKTALEFVEEVAEATVRKKPAIVGATTIFQQNMASLAVLRRIKEMNGDITTILGGANCEEPMGSALEAVCPWIDHVHKGRSEGHVDRLFRLEAAHGCDANPEPESRFPDFTDYFTQLENYEVRRHIYPALPIEMSTGCWYGEKSHCTFCGLNGTSMRFNFREAGDVYDELAHQKEKYRISRFMAVDNILALNYFKTLLPRIVETKLDVHLFVETKANLKRKQLELMAEAGFDWIQPGIESLHDDKLKRFKKGTDLKTNISVLKLSLEQGMVASWLLLVNEPGERAQEYQEMAVLLPKLYHLFPPTSIVRIRFDRYSPFQSRHKEFGLELEPFKAYSFLYPAATDLEKLAYYFEDYGLERISWDSPEMTELHRAHKQWGVAFYGGNPTKMETNCVLQLDRDSMEVTDTRQPGKGKRYRLSERAVAVLDALNEGMVKSLFEKQFPGFDISPLLDRDLAIDTGDHYLSLVMRKPVRPLPEFEDFPCGAVLGA